MDLFGEVTIKSNVLQLYIENGGLKMFNRSRLKLYFAEQHSEGDREMFMSIKPLRLVWL